MTMQSEQGREQVAWGWLCFAGQRSCEFELSWSLTWSMGSDSGQWAVPICEVSKIWDQAGKVQLGNRGWHLLSTSRPQNEYRCSQPDVRCESAELLKGSAILVLILPLIVLLFKLTGYHQYLHCSSWSASEPFTFQLFLFLDICLSCPQSLLCTLVGWPKILWGSLFLPLSSIYIPHPLLLCDGLTQAFVTLEFPRLLSSSCPQCYSDWCWMAHWPSFSPPPYTACPVGICWITSQINFFHGTFVREELKQTRLSPNHQFNLFRGKINQGEGVY